METSNRDSNTSIEQSRESCKNREQSNEWVTETQAMLDQIKLKDKYLPHRSRRRLLTLASVLKTVEEKDEENTGHAKLVDLIFGPEEDRNTDYETINKQEYKPPYPIRAKSPPPPPPPMPWMLNRRISYTPESLEKRDGINTFLDDNLEPRQKITEIKQHRNKIIELLSRNEKKSECNV